MGDAPDIRKGGGGLENRPVSRSEAEEVRVGWKMAGIGMQVASEVMAGALLGWLFDYWRGRGHVGVIVGSICGICVGLFSLVRQSLKLNALLDRTAPLAGRGKPAAPLSRAPSTLREAAADPQWEERARLAEQALKEMEDDDRLEDLDWNGDDDERDDWNSDRDDSASEPSGR